MANETISQESGTQGRATELAGAARDEAQGVAGDARREASAVASEAGVQARRLVDEARSALRHQAFDGTSRAAGAIDELGGRLRSLAEGHPEQAGDLRRYAAEFGDRLSGLADRLGTKGFDGVVDDVQSYARRRPGLFLAAAAASGFVAGRLFRGTQAESNGSAGSDQPTGRPDAQYTATPPVGTAVPGQIVPESGAEYAGSIGGTTPATVPYGGATSPPVANGSTAAWREPSQDQGGSS